MELALYHPEHGYYSGRADRGARSGDFLTAPELHPIFGHALAGQLDEMWRLLDRPSPFVLRDEGAGSGALGIAVLEGLRRERSELLDAIRYLPVEVSDERIEAIGERLRRAGLASHLEQDRGDPIVGCLVANELLDALPVHRVVVRGSRLRELAVGWRDGRLGEEEVEPSTPALEEYFEAAGIDLADGQRAEVNLVALDRVAGFARVLRSGFALVIDYGHPAGELYGPARRAGTLLAYRGHAVSDDPYAAPGRQDLTAHVDVTAVERAARGAGLAVLGRTTQAEFLAGLGLGDRLVGYRPEEGGTLEGYLEARGAVLRLLDPRHLGRFFVLVLGARVAPGTSLRGLSFRLAR